MSTINLTINGDFYFKTVWYGEKSSVHYQSEETLVIPVIGLRCWKGTVGVFLNNYKKLDENTVEICGKAYLGLDDPKDFDKDGTLREGLLAPGGFRIEGNIFETIDQGDRKIIIMTDAEDMITGP